MSILHSGWEIQAEVLKRVWVSEENHGFGGHQTIGGGGESPDWRRLSRDSEERHDEICFLQIFQAEVWCQDRTESQWT